MFDLLGTPWNPLSAIVVAVRYIVCWISLWERLYITSSTARGFLWKSLFQVGVGWADTSAWPFILLKYHWTLDDRNISLIAVLGWYNMNMPFLLGRMAQCRTSTSWADCVRTISPKLKNSAGNDRGQVFLLLIKVWLSSIFGGACRWAVFPSSRLLARRKISRHAGKNCDLLGKKATRRETFPDVPGSDMLGKIATRREKSDASGKKRRAAKYFWRAREIPDAPEIKCDAPRATGRFRSLSKIYMCVLINYHHLLSL